LTIEEINMKTSIQNLRIPVRAEIPNQGVTVLAGDIGGTKTNLAMYQGTEDGLTLLKQERYPSEEYTSFIDVLKKFLRDNSNATPDAVCLGVAGPVLEGTVELTNLGWMLDVADVKKELGIERAALLNDLEVTAYGLAGLQADDFITIHPGNESSRGNMAIVAPGTGLGEAGLYWSGRSHHPFATEGGHCDFAPRTDLDIEFFTFLREKYGVVSWERVVAGPAIADIYTFLRDVKKRPEPGWLTAELEQQQDDSAVISKAAVQQKAPICIETMEHFVRYLAHESANLVLKMKAVGGLFLGGGIPPKIAPLLQQPAFMQHYMDCDRMQHLLEGIPVRIIKNDKTALIGAAWYGAYGDWLEEVGGRR
jgi:glucokinase